MSEANTRDATVIPQEPGFAAIGTTIAGRYKVEALLGTGGMGAVYLVQHTLMHKRFALKMLNAETSRLPEMVARFEREAIAAGRIDHPNIAAASDFGRTEDGAFFLVLEYLEGKRLRDAIATGPLPPRRALHIAMQVASALERTHELGIIHRDLIAANLPSLTAKSEALQISSAGSARSRPLETVLRGALQTCGVVAGSPGAAADSATPWASAAVDVGAAGASA